MQCQNNTQEKTGGQTLIEFLVILSLMLVMFGGMIQYCLISQIKAALNVAAFHAARKYAITHKQASAKKVAEKYLLNMPFVIVDKVGVSVLESALTHGKPVHVKTTVSCRIVPMPGVSTLMGIDASGRLALDKWVVATAE